jgi:hypothetical protein
LGRNVSQVRGVYVTARCLALVLRKATTAFRIEEPEIVLRRSVSLVGGEPVQASGLAIVLPQAAATSLIEDPEVVLRLR